MALILIIAAFLYLVIGLYCRHREEGHRPNCPTGFKAVTSTILFWPYKMPIVFYRKYFK